MNGIGCRTSRYFDIYNAASFCFYHILLELVLLICMLFLLKHIVKLTKVIFVIIFPDNGVKWYCIVQLNFIEQEKFNISCVANSNVQELMRGIRTQMDSLISLPTKEMSAMALGLAHRYILLLYQHLVLDAVNKGWMQKGSICFFNQQTSFTLIPEMVVSFI